MYRHKKCKMMTILGPCRYWTPVPAPGFQFNLICKLAENRLKKTWNQCKGRLHRRIEVYNIYTVYKLQHSTSFTVVICCVWYIVHYSLLPILLTDSGNYSLFTSFLLVLLYHNFYIIFSKKYFYRTGIVSLVSIVSYKGFRQSLNTRKGVKRPSIGKAATSRNIDNLDIPLGVGSSGELSDIFDPALLDLEVAIAKIVVYFHCRPLTQQVR